MAAAKGAAKAKARASKAKQPATNAGDKPIVFLGWSGDRSKAVALALRGWLGTVIQVEPWMSERDIATGDFWGEEVQAALARACYGVFCVTQENVQSPWVNYEAGALAVRLRGCAGPYLHGVSPGELKSMPLSRLQASKADKDGTTHLVSSINDALGGFAIESPIAKNAVESQWQHLEAKLAAIAPTAPRAKRDVADMFEEILGLLRTIAERMPGARPSSATDAVAHAAAQAIANRRGTPDAANPRVRWLPEVSQEELDAILRDAGVRFPGSKPR